MRRRLKTIDVVSKIHTNKNLTRPSPFAAFAFEATGGSALAAQATLAFSFAGNALNN
jgi:hypothetical protein